MRDDKGGSRTTLERHNYQGMRSEDEPYLVCSCGWRSSEISRTSYDAHYQYQEWRRHKAKAAEGRRAQE